MNKTSLDAPITTTVAALSDQRLLQRIKELSAVEHQIEVVVIDHLREIERRGLYLTLGFSGMFDYVVRGLGYSNGAAWRRLKGMRLCEVEGARTLLQEGTLTLDAAAQLQHAFDRQKRKANRSTTSDTEKHAGDGGGAEAGARAGATPGGSAPEASAREAGAAGAPSGLAPAAPVRTGDSDGAPVLDSAERESLVAQAAGKSTRQVRQMLAKVDPELARPADRMRPLGAGRWELKAVIDDDCQVGLEQLKGLLSHVDPQMTLGQLLGRVVKEALDRHDPSRPPRRRRRSRRTPVVAAETSAPKDAARPDAGAARNVLPAVPATSPATGPADHDRRDATPAKRPAAGTGTATSAPKDIAGAAQRTELPGGAATSPATVPAGPDPCRATPARRPAAATLTGDVAADTSAPKQGAGAEPRTALPEDVVTSPATADRPAVVAGISASAPKVGGAGGAPLQARVRGRAIPAAVKRQVWERDQGCCSYVDRGSGRRCGSRHLLEIDHVVPYAVGGSAEPDNLRLLCAAHHRYRHRRARHGAACR